MSPHRNNVIGGLGCGYLGVWHRHSRGRTTLNSRSAQQRTHVLPSVLASVDQAAAQYDFRCPPSSVLQTSLYFVRSSLGGSSFSRTGGRSSRPVCPRRLLYQSAPIFRMFMVRSTSNSLIHAVRAASRPFEISQDTPDCPNHSLQFIRLLSRFSVTRHAQNAPPKRSWNP
jgi:hypothetical protein